MNKVNAKDVLDYVCPFIPEGIHISLNFTKDSYTQEEADEVLKQVLEAWEIIEKLRK